MTPAAEFNIWADPEAAARVFASGLDVTMIGLDVTHQAVTTPATVDLRLLIADHARAAGVKSISLSPLCTRCDNDRFYSHRAGDAGRQLGVIVAN